jgi:ribonuclease Z
MMARLHLLGCGTPTPTPTRFGTAYVLELQDDCLLIDCGPATTHKLVKAGLWPTQISHLFFTHHHFDHNVDYPCFLLCRWDQSTGKEERLIVRGPEPTALITQRLIGPDGAFVDDWTARVEHPTSQHVHQNRGGSLPRPRPEVDVADIAPGDTVESAGWRMRAAVADHMQPWLNCLSYRLDCDGHSLVFAGDTQPCATLAELADGAEILVVNCWDHQATMEANGEAPGQTGTLDAAHLARQAGAGKLILTHTGKRLADSREQALADIRELYDGEVIFGEELLSLELW